MLAELFLSSDQRAVGRAVLEQAAAENPKYPGVYVASANQALAEGRRLDAVVLYEKAEALAQTEKLPQRQKRLILSQCRARLAAIAEERRDWPAAEAAIKAWLELDPKNGALRERLARALFHQNNEDAALAELEQAVKDDPSLKPAEVNLGLLLAEKGDLSEAVKRMQAAAARSPDDARTRLELGHCLLEQGRIAEAKACAEAAQKLDGSLRALKVLNGAIALRSKDFPEAERQYQALVNDSPEDSVARDRLALALVEQSSADKKRRALELANVNARLNPNAAGPLSTLGWVYYRLGRADEAERVLRGVMSGTAPRPDAAYYLGRMLSEQGHKEEAKKLLELALRAPGGELTFRQDAEKYLDQLTKTTP
jgi:tetratricopeptide (TPR) repeat protein